jgi:hypothetical protein
MEYSKVYNIAYTRLTSKVFGFPFKSVTVTVEKIAQILLKASSGNNIGKCG